MYLVSAYFDEKSNNTLDRLIRAVADKTGNTFMTDNNVPAHITSAAIEARNVDVLVSAFSKLEGKLEKGTVNIVSIGQLLPYVCFVQPVLNAYLDDIMRKINTQMSGISETSISRYYQPYSWLPHITIGKTLNREQMQIAVSTLQDTFTPFTATITEIGLARVNPHEDVSRIKLI